MIAKIVNMEPDELIGSLGDCHIYENQFEGVKEQLERKGNENLPTLKINGFQHTIEDFNFDDFEIIGYNPDPPIKFPLSVG
jgi:thymidylate synthase